MYDFPETDTIAVIWHLKSKPHYEQYDIRNHVALILKVFVIVDVFS